MAYVINIRSYQKRESSKMERIATSNHSLQSIQIHESGKKWLKLNGVCLMTRKTMRTEMVGSQRRLQKPPAINQRYNSVLPLMPVQPMAAGAMSRHQPRRHHYRTQLYPPRLAFLPSSLDLDSLYN